MTTCSILVDVITRASPLFAIIRSMRLHQLNDEDYRYAFMLCFERYPENERQMCVIRCARWMRYMPVVEAMLKLQPLSKKQWLQLSRNMLMVEGSQMDLPADEKHPYRNQWVYHQRQSDDVCDYIRDKFSF